MDDAAASLPGGRLMPTIPFIGQDAAHHDLHHEKFLNNYALSYMWLDALGGYLVPGRIPGQQLPKEAQRAKNAAAPTAAAASSVVVDADGTPMSDNDSVQVASFSQLKDCTKADVELLAEKYNEENAKNLVNRVIGMLTDQDKPELMLGAKITLYEHGLQTATRAFYDGASEDYVVGALLHDIGEMHCPSNHGEVPVSILRPFLEPEVSWVLEQHEVFQMYYYAHKVRALALPPRGRTGNGRPDCRPVSRLMVRLLSASWLALHSSFWARRENHGHLFSCHNQWRWKHEKETRKTYVIVVPYVSRRRCVSV